MAQRHKGTKAQREKGSMAKRHNGAMVQWRKGEKGRGGKSILLEILQARGVCSGKSCNMDCLHFRMIS